MRLPRVSLLLVALLFVTLGSKCASDRPSKVSDIGAKAYDLTRTLTLIGPRPPGSAGIEKVREWIEREAKKMGFTLQRDPFVGHTPIGNIDMVNLSYEIRGKENKERVILVAHYDTKRFIGFDFVGANDAASSVALLLVLSPEISKRHFPFTTEILFVDGEESIGTWTSTDSLHGSRRRVTRPDAKSGVRAAIIVDMIGDTELNLIDESTCDPNLRKKLKEVLANLGWESLLETHTSIVEDDHRPFVDAGIKTLHLMDFTFGGPTNPGLYWHTKEDTIEKISPTSLSAVGEILLRLLAKV